MKKTKKRLLCFSFIGILLLANTVSVMAQGTGNDTEEVIGSNYTTTVTILNEKTGEENVYTIDVEPTITIEQNEDGETIITEEIKVGSPSPEIRPFADVSVSDNFYGYKGTLRYVYTDDGMFACLTTCSGTWERTSGTYSISDRGITYGQVLGTNSASGFHSMSGSYIQFTTGFKAGKYGKGCYLGGTLTAKIAGSYWVSINHNKNF